MPGRHRGGPAGAAGLRAAGIPVVRTRRPVVVVVGSRAVLPAGSVAKLVAVVCRVEDAAGVRLAASRGARAPRVVAIEVVPEPEAVSTRAVVMTLAARLGVMTAVLRVPGIGRGPGPLGSGLLAPVARARRASRGVPGVRLPLGGPETGQDGLAVDGLGRQVRPRVERQGPGGSPAAVAGAGSVTGGLTIGHGVRHPARQARSGRPGTRIVEGRALMALARSVDRSVARARRHRVR